MVGYDGPIYMTHPTKAICPILLEDYRKITVDKKGETNFFTSQMIKDCMKKVVAVHLHQTVQVNVRVCVLLDRTDRAVVEGRAILPFQSAGADAAFASPCRWMRSWRSRRTMQATC